MAGLNIKAETEIIDQNKKNGNDFEKFVVQKFDKKYFSIKNWACGRSLCRNHATTRSSDGI